MFGKAQFAKSRKKKPFTSLILTWLSIMYEVCFLDTPPVLIGLRTGHYSKSTGALAPVAPVPGMHIKIFYFESTLSRFKL